MNVTMNRNHDARGKPTSAHSIPADADHSQDTLTSHVFVPFSSVVFEIPSILRNKNTKAFVSTCQSIQTKQQSGRFICTLSP